MKRIDKNTYHFFFDKNEKPVLNIESGETVCFEVQDACLNELDGVPSIKARMEKKRPSGPLCGPVFIKGAEPGDTIAVEIIDVELRDGFQLIGPNRAIVKDEIPDWTFYKVTAEGNQIKLDNGLTFKIDPVIGTFGNAPAGEPTNLEFDCGGNYDVPFVKIGSILYLPVEVPGALFSIGDVHALQGDGEVVGAPEMNAEITARLKLIKKNPITRSHFMIEQGGCMHTPTYAKTEYEAVRRAVFFNARYISERYGIELKDALVVLTMLGKISVSRMTYIPYLSPIVTSSYPIIEVENAIKGIEGQK